MDLRAFYKGKRVFVTGHTGFKGTWMCKILLQFGATVTGYSLNPPTVPSLYDLSGIGTSMKSIIGDIRDRDNLVKAMETASPDIVIHMAAQPIVLESYKNPAYTYETNVIGTVNVLEAVRKCSSVKSFINVTTDKVYLNKEWEWGYRENEELKGFDPYSNSKSCSELVTFSYVNSFFNDSDSAAISTCRAGNVIGGGDFATDRIIPDCVRALMGNRVIEVRNPNSTRPYQHVLEPVMAYLLIAAKQFEDKSFAGNYNIGPNEENCVATGDLVSLFCELWNNKRANSKIKWECKNANGPHEANYLKLDCSKMKKVFSWEPKWNVETALTKVIEWTKVYMADGDISAIMMEQIEDYLR